MRRRLGYPDDPEINASLQADIEAAAETVSDRLRAQLDRVDLVDTFFVRGALEFESRSVRRHVSDRRPLLYGDESTSTLQLMLSRGFVDIEQTVTIYAATTEDLLDDVALRTDLTNVEGSGVDHVTIDAECGVVRVHDFRLRNAYVRVSCKTGFLTDGDDPAVYQGTPTWLLAAGDLEARILTNSNAVYGRGPVAEPVQKRLEGRLNNVLRSHARYAPMSWKPINSSATSSAT